MGSIKRTEMRVFEFECGDDMEFCLKSFLIKTLIFFQDIKMDVNKETEILCEY